MNGWIILALMLGGYLVIDRICGCIENIKKKKEDKPWK